MSKFIGRVQVVLHKSELESNIFQALSAVFNLVNTEVKEGLQNEGKTLILKELHSPCIFLFLTNIVLDTS